MFGFLVLNKPAGITSRAALNQLNKCIWPNKVGHAGTLDPLATGVLVACIGPATRLTRYVQQMPKQYTASFRLGLDSPTEDIEGDVISLVDAPPVTADELSAVLPNFLGKIMQTPPTFSALRVDGQRAYDLAREGTEVKLKPRPIQIDDLQLRGFDYPDFQLEITCGSGTYVRSLGRDIARRLDSAAVMTALTRTAIGKFRISKSLDIESLNREVCQAKLLSPDCALPGREIVPVDRQQVRGFVDGVPLRLEENLRQIDEELVAVDGRNRLVAVLRRKYDGIFAPSINFAHYWEKIDQAAGE